MLELRRHGVVLHRHEQRVQDDADGDGQVHERVHDDQVHDLFQFYPVGVALPDEESVGEFVPARRALPLRLFQLCQEKRTEAAPPSQGGSEGGSCRSSPRILAADPRRAELGLALCPPVFLPKGREEAGSVPGHFPVDDDDLVMNKPQPVCFGSTAEQSGA